MRHCPGNRDDPAALYRSDQRGQRPCLRLCDRASGIKARERCAPLSQDERDQAINARATRLAYDGRIAGVRLVGMARPFDRSGRRLVNAALLVIVMIDVARNGMIAFADRTARHAA